MSRRDDTPRDLLFGLLALQNGMVSRDHLVASFGGWTATAGRPMMCEWACLTMRARTTQLCP